MDIDTNTDVNTDIEDIEEAECVGSLFSYEVVEDEDKDEDEDEDEDALHSALELGLKAQLH